MYSQIISIVDEVLSLVPLEFSVIPGHFKIYGYAAQILIVQLFGDPDHYDYNPLCGSGLGGDVPDCSTLAD